MWDILCRQGSVWRRVTLTLGTKKSSHLCPSQLMAPISSLALMISQPRYFEILCYVYYLPLLSEGQCDFWCSIGTSKKWYAAYSWLDASVLMTVFNVSHCPYRIHLCQCLQCVSLPHLSFGQISCAVACCYWEGLTKFVVDMWTVMGY